MTPRSGEQANETYAQLWNLLLSIYQSLNKEYGIYPLHLEKIVRYRLMFSCAKLVKEDSESWREVVGWPRIYRRTGIGWSTSSRLSSEPGSRKSSWLSKTSLIGLSLAIFALGLVVAVWQGYSQPILWGLSMWILFAIILCL